MAEIDLGIEGMTCAACVTRVEKVLKRVPGVAAAEVNLATNSARVHADAGVKLEALTEAVSRAGYTAVPVAQARHAKPDPLWPVLVAAFFALWSGGLYLIEGARQIKAAGHHH